MSISLMNGITVSEGLSEGKAFLIQSNDSFDNIDIVRSLSASEEIVKYRQASRDFATKLNNAMSGTVPDKVRDLFGAVASYITNLANISAIEEKILHGATATEAATEVLLSKINRFSQQRELQTKHTPFISEDNKAHLFTKDVDKLKDICVQAEIEEDNELVEASLELSSLMRDFIQTIDSAVPCKKILPQLTEPSVIIASDLSPATFLSLHTELVRAVILEGGMSSNHLSTVLRDLRIPAIYGVKGALTIKSGELVLVDAYHASILVAPPPDTARALIAQQDMFKEEEDVPDNELKVTVAGSMGAMGDIDRLSAYFSHGLGLLRSEFLFLNFREEPSCEEMTKTFATIFSKIPKSAPLTARTFDFAGDKNPLFTVETDDSGPLRKYGANVGSRLLKKELKALLLASEGRDIYIVFPLITRLSEARALNELLEEAKHELRQESLPHGIAHIVLMIETPAAVLSARAFASFAEMFLIGTSSLAEYASAPRPPEEYFTPALCKMIAIACKAGHDEGVRVGLAGRFAVRPELLPLYLSLGVSYITADATSLTKVRKSLQKLNDRGIEPCFKLDLYNNLMDIASARDLQRLILDEENNR